MAQSIVTRAFEAWNVKKTLDGQPAVPDQIVFALIPNQDENQAVSRDEGMPAAAAIKHRAAITQSGVLNTNAVVYSVVLDTTIGDWDYNWIGLVDSKTNTVLMIVHVRTQQKIKTQNGRQGNSLTRNLAMQFDGAAAATQINVSAATWQIDFSARLFSMDEALRAAMLDYYGPAAFLGDGFKVSVSGSQATIAPGVGYVGGLRATLDAAAKLTVSANTGVWLDVSRQGAVTGAWENRITFTAAATLANYTDAAGYAHYVTKIATITNGQVASNRPLSPISELDKRFLPIEGTAAAATKLATARKIAGVAFDGTADITLSASAVGALAKDQNGADIPDKSQFRQNVGLNDAVIRGEFGIGGQSAAIPESVDVLEFFKTAACGCYSAYSGRNTGIPDGDVSYAFHWTPTLNNEYGSLKAVGLNSGLLYHISINGGRWGEWTKFYTTQFKPTAADVGALPITGGALEGGIRIGAGNIDLPASRAVVGMMPDGSYKQMLSLSPDNTVVMGNPNSSVVIHTNDRAYIAAVGGAWHSIYHDGNLTPAAIGAMPTSELAGIPLPFPAAVAPTGWLKCNGQQFDTAQFPVLASRYPSGFLPDLRGEFVRGWDDGRGADVGRGLMSAQGDAIRNITGSLFYGYDADGKIKSNSSAGALYYDESEKLHDTDSYQSLVPDGGANAWYPSKLDASRVVPTASENRPRNIAFNYIVRAA